MGKIEKGKKDCYGKRLEAYDKCEQCDIILHCSIITLEKQFGDKIEIVV